MADPLPAPLVSVQIPSYNHAAFIGEAVESVMAQKVSRIELLVVDDASTDGTPAVLRALAGRYPDRLTVVCETRNQGPGCTANTLMGMARGEYLALLSSDDRMHPDRLRLQLEHLQAHPEAGAVFSEVNWIGPDGRPVSPGHDVFSTPIADLRRQLIRGNILNASSAMLRMRAVRETGGFDASLLYVQDFDYWLRMLDRWEIHRLSGRLTDYRAHGSNLSFERQRIGMNYETVMAILRALRRWPLERLFDLPAPAEAQARRESEALACAHLAQHCLWLDRKYFGRPLLATADAYQFALEALARFPDHTVGARSLALAYEALGDAPRARGNASAALADWRRGGPTSALSGAGKPRRGPRPLSVDGTVVAGTISVIVPTRGKPELVRTCLQHLAASVRPEGCRLEALVLEQGGTESRLAPGRGTGDGPGLQVAWLQAPDEANFSELNNAGADATRGDCLLLLNNDCFVAPDCIAQMVRVLREDESIGVVGAKLLFEDGRLQHVGVRLEADGTPRHIAYRGPDDGSIAEACVDSSPEAVTFACALIRRDCWEAVGGLDPGYHFNYEDIDFCLGALEQGWGVVLAHRARATHLEGASTESRSSFDHSKRRNLRVFRAKWLDSGRIRAVLPGSAVGTADVADQSTSAPAGSAVPVRTRSLLGRVIRELARAVSGRR